MVGTAVELVNVTKRFGEKIAVKGVSFQVEKGSFATLLGPSGSGKTTILRCIAGFIKPDEGDIFLNGQRVTHLPPEKRNVGMVFQNYALWPHMTVFDNIAFGLKIRKIPSDEIRRRVREVLELVRLPGYENRYPRQLSGGEQQRVALARALVVEPEVLLLDEPLSNLDAKLRVSMRRELKRIQSSLRITTIYVTHDQEEALSLSDKIIVMNHGVKIQEGSPYEIYFKPRDSFVAEFVGVRNLVEGRVVEVSESEMLIDIGLDRPVKAYRDKDQLFGVGDRVILAVRSESIEILKERPGIEENVFRGKISSKLFLGVNIQYFVKTGDIEWVVIRSEPDRVLDGEVYIVLDKSRLHVIKR